MPNIIKKSYGILHRYFFDLPSNMAFAKKIFSDESKAYLVINDHIGDFLIAMGYLQAFREHHHVKHLVLCTTPRLKSIALRYAGPEDEILALGRSELHQLLFIPTTKTSAAWFREKGNIWFAHPEGFQPILFDYYLSAFPGITFRQVVQYGCLRLPEDAKFQPLPIPVQSAGDRKPAIILCPASQNGLWKDYAPSDFFERLLSQLGKYNLDLYTNIGPYDSDECALPSTRPLRMSLEELGEWIVPGDIVIGIRSGIMDFLSYYDCNIVCLYAPIDWFASFYTLDMLPGKRCHYTEHIIEGPPEQELQTVLESIENFIRTDS